MISNQEIRKQVVHETTYTQGIKYYSKGKVAHLNFDPKTRTFSAEVLGQQKYKVAVSFDDSKTVTYASCQCQAYASYKGACKHIVAVLKSVQMNWEKHWKLDYRDLVPDLETVTKNLGKQEVIDLVNDEDESVAVAKQMEKLSGLRRQISTDRFFSQWDEQNQELSGETVCSIVPTLVLQIIGTDHSELLVEFNVRHQRIYLLKDLMDFVMAWSSRRPYALGKTLTIHPKETLFDAHSLRLLQFLEDCLWNDIQTKEGRTAYVPTRTGNSSAMFSQRFLKLNDRSLSEFLELMAQQGIDFKWESYLEREQYKVHIVKDQPPISMAVTDIAGRLMLELPYSQKQLKVLDRAGRYILLNQLIYAVPDTYARVMRPLLAQSSELPSIQVDIADERMDQFFSLILPQLEQYAEVKLEESLEDKVLREPLEIEVYLDQWQGEIMADLVFKYGTKEVQPFAEKPMKDAYGLRLIRDIALEQECLNWFANTGFYKIEGALRLSDVEAIGDFYTSGLEELISMGTVYRTERFLQTKVKLPNPFKVKAVLEDQNRLLELSVETSGLSKDEMLQLILAHREKKRFVRLKNGDLYALEGENAIGEIDELANHLNIKVQQLLSAPIELPAYRAIYLEAMARDKQSLRFERNQAFKQMIQTMQTPEDYESQVPQSLSGILRDYQKTGFKWLKMLSSFGFGGILADDMGLGKTLQVLAFILSEKEKREADGEAQGLNLIVVPTSLIYNWQAEMERFAPSLEFAIVLGTKSDRFDKLKALEGKDVVITTYGLLKRDLDYYRTFNFAACFIDEAQHIKNANTLSAKSVKCIKAKYTFALTGTPIENGLTELWSIFDFIMPGYLYQNTQFINRYANPIAKDGNQEVLKHLRRHIQPFVLRRLKHEVLQELPEKIESRMVNQMTTEQAKQYSAWQMRAKKEFEAEVYENRGGANKIKILALLTRLRQLACHPGLFLENYSGSSGKLEQLIELVEDAISGGHRMLIFSQFTSLLALVKPLLKDAGIGFYYIDGSVSAEDRIKQVKAFNEGEMPVFLISLKAGGTGLNLTGADVVVHLDPWWNPAVEDQATDRAHRIGQTKVVQVVKMITKGTIEEKIDQLKEKKRQLISEMITTGDTWMEQLSIQDLSSLFED